MGDYTVVGEAGRSMVRLIWNAIAADPNLSALITSEAMISLESPADHIENNDTALLSVYLYRIGENGFMRNRGAVEGPGGGLRRAPLPLDLSYLITPMLADAYDRHVVLGKVMQVLQEHPILQGDDLTGTLAGTDDVLRITVDPLPMNEITLVWQALEIPYMLCVPYVMRVAMLQSDVDVSGTRVVSADRGFGARAPALMGSA